MNPIDQAAATSELFLRLELQNAADPARLPVWTGYCLNCGEKVDAPLLFCDDEEDGCRKDYEARRATRDKQHFRGVVR